MTANAFTVDVEDWFHILDCPQMPQSEDYPQFESRVEANTDHILDVLDEYSVKGTFFVLGWVADQCSGLVRRIADAGHEIGVHGYAHVLAGSISDRELEQDTRRAVRAVTNASGVLPVGYRSPGGSLLEQHRWMLDLLLDLGIRYDSSVYPRRGGLAEAEGFPDEPYIIHTSSDKKTLWEFPSTIRQSMGMSWAFAEGGYLRLLPLPLVNKWFRERDTEGRPVSCCLHPRELDPTHPRLKLSPYRQWKTRVGLHGMERKIRFLLKNYEFQPMGEVLKNYKERLSI